jgi:hypothetical protein
MPRTKEPARKLAEFAKRARLERQKKVIKRDDGGKPVEFGKFRIDWKQCPNDLRAAEANRATTLAPFGYDDTTVREFFDEFDRDPLNPWHWRELFYYLIESHTRKPKRSQWSDSRLHDLLIRSKGYPEEIKDSKIIQLLRKDFLQDYKHIADDGSLRKRLIEARRRFPEVAP